MTLLLLCWEFFKIGLFAIGGGLATLPFLSDLATRHPEWLTHELLANMVAISESTPGPIGVNMATYVGYTVGGIGGAVAATFSLVLPSILIILVIARFLERYRSSRLVDGVFSLLRPTVTGLIAAAGWSMLQLALLSTQKWVGFDGLLAAVSLPKVILFVVFTVCTQLKWTKKLHPILWIGIGAAAGLVLGL